MLDLKLASYWPFVELVDASGGGMFVTASDDFEAFAVTDTELHDAKNSLKKMAEASSEPMLVSLAHPSSLDVAAGHGVFLFADNEESAKTATATLIDSCQEVLQKPSIKAMRNTPGLVRTGAFDQGCQLKATSSKSCFVLESETGEEYAYTDSAYWINPALMRKLKKFYESLNGKIPAVETSMYGDFMGCQGAKRSDRLTTAFDDGSEDARFKRKVAQIMNDVPLKVRSTILKTCRLLSSQFLILSASHLAQLEVLPLWHGQRVSGCALPRPPDRLRTRLRIQEGAGVRD